MKHFKTSMIDPHNISETFMNMSNGDRMEV